MKFSENWLREWVNPPLNAIQMADQLTMAGLEIESVTSVAKPFNKVVVGEVLEVSPHPNADKLRVCQVNVGQTEALTIVCGAANVRAGQKVPVALEGAILGDDFKIKSSKLRGVMSQGMICSTSELGLSETSEGIMELPADAPLGQDFRQWLQLDDHVFDIHVTPNRGDCLSIIGIAREVALLNELAWQPNAAKKIAPSLDDKFEIKVSDAKDCPRYCGRIIRGINANAKTPLWMIERLRRSGIRNIHPVVDVTNYVLLELGQPLHAFDLNKLKGNIQVRLAKENETLVLLDEQKISLDKETLIIADAEKALAVAGIMGGLESSVTTTTEDIFLESAFFNPVTIAGKARRYGLDTDSAYRFERGVDFNLAPYALERATQLLLEIVGGKPGPVTEFLDEKFLPRAQAISLRAKQVNKVLGVVVDSAFIEKSLKCLGMALEHQSDGWQITPPSHRFDLNLEVDLIEEIARIYGYQKIPERAPVANLEILANSDKKIDISRLRNYLVDHGYHEAITYSFISPKLQQIVEPEKKFLVLQNPISADLSVMRTSLWPGLLNAVSYNQNRQQTRIRFFETGLRFNVVGTEVIQQPVLAGVISGNRYHEQWGTPQKPCDFFDLKGDVEELLNLTHQTIKFERGRHPALHPGQTSEIYLGEKKIGYMGALHPSIADQLDLQLPIYLFEIELEPITQAILPSYNVISKFPAIRRDISFIIKQEISIQQIAATIKNAAGELLADLIVFDVYQGKGVETGFRSLALGLTWQDANRTLVDAEVNEQMEKVVTSLKQDFAINLRD